MALSEAEKIIRRKLRDDFTHYANKCLKIRSKSGEIVPFAFNTAQIYMHNKVEQQLRDIGRVRAIICKGRQMGCSTYVGGRFYHKVTHRFGIKAFILTHEKGATENLFEMTQRYHNHCPTVVRPTVDTSNAKELSFLGLDSGYKIGTAGNKAVGRSATIQLLHGSEVAYWPNAAEHAKGILQSVPNDAGTEVFLESTAEGLGNYFHEQWQLAESGQSDFIPIFVPWYWQEEYRREAPHDFILSDEEMEITRLYNLTPQQITWRRYKITDLSVGGMDGSKAFMSQYPNTSTEAFVTTGEDNFIAPNIVMAARRCNAEPHGNLVIGCDPARFGDDRTSIIRRKGRVAYKLESYAKKDTMEVAGILHRIIIDESPSKVFVDIGGLGAGVYDRLRELGHVGTVVGVNAGSTPLHQDRYYNKRAEMWGLLREWLLDVPVKIPDADDLHADLCAPTYKFDSKTRLLIEKKEDMKRRGIRSPDCADALCLTFAMPDKSLGESRRKEDARTARSVMGTFNRIDKLKKSAYR